MDSISFPVLHAENVDGSEELTPFIMLLAMKTYLEENHNKMNFLKHINIIIKVEKKWFTDFLDTGQPNDQEILDCV